MAKERPLLEFLADQAGEEEGLGHAGIETYKDAPYASVARECGQNSADAGVRKPVVVKFDLIEIDREEYPPLAKHHDAIDACLLKADQKNNEKEIDFFTRAIEVLDAKKIKILRIADYNTKGLIGPPKPGLPFHSLVKASGVSNKDSDIAGGSFGIGKNAAFAVSELQTVFYSTVYRNQDSGRQEFLAQGKTILISHKDNNSPRRGTGYWGMPEFEPINNVDDAPAWLHRSEVGTSVFVIGFRECANWQLRMAASLLSNFFCAVHRGDMEFSIDSGNLMIDRSTIKMLFQDREVDKAAKDSTMDEDFMFSRHLYDCLISPETVEKEMIIRGMGKVLLRILINEGLPKRVCIIRNGMIITDNLEYFGDKFARFPMFKDFVALVEPVEHDGNALIKSLENPRHDGLSAERLPNADKREKAIRIIKNLAKEIRSVIAKEALPKPVNEIALDELSEFFADREETDPPHQPDSDENPESFTYKPGTSRKQRIAKVSAVQIDETGGSGGTGGHSSGSGGGTGLGTGRGSGGSGVLGHTRTVTLGDVRNVLAPEGSGWHRKLFFTPDETGKATVTVLSPGLESSEILNVIRTDNGQAQNGNIVLNLAARERISVNVAFSEFYDGPIELVSTMIQEG